jgi:hypothetical protein
LYGTQNRGMVDFSSPVLLAKLLLWIAWFVHDGLWWLWSRSRVCYPSCACSSNSGNHEICTDSPMPRRHIQVVSRRFPSAEVAVRSRGSQCGNCGGKNCIGTALISRNSISFCQLFHHCSTFIHLSFGGWAMGPLQASVPADTNKRKLIRWLDRIRTDKREEPAVSNHPLQAFYRGSFTDKYYFSCYCPITSDNLSVLKYGKEDNLLSWPDTLIKCSCEGSRPNK